MSDEILKQILSNQEKASDERTSQGIMIAEIRTVLLGTANPPSPGLSQNFATFQERTTSRLNRLEKGAMLTLLGLSGTGAGTAAYWNTIKTMLGWH